jgi:hypothetical protein
MSVRVRTSWLVIVLASACDGDVAVPCGADLFCPPNTTCAADNLCVADEDTCQAFADDTPCLSTIFGRGRCIDGTCDRGVRIFGVTHIAPELTPLDNVEVRVLAEPAVPAFTTSPTGLFELAAVPRDAEVVVTFSSPGMMPGRTRSLVLRSDDIVVADEPTSCLTLVPMTTLQVIAAVAGSSVMPGRGVIAGGVYDGDVGVGLEGATASVTGTTCDGPIYFRNQAPNPDATSTSAESPVFLFINCQPGPATVTVTGFAPPGGCVASGRASDRKTDMPLEVITDEMTYLGRIDCFRTEPSP